MFQYRHHHAIFGYFYVYSLGVAAKFFEEAAAAQVGVVAVKVKFLVAGRPYIELHFGEAILIRLQVRVFEVGEETNHIKFLALVHVLQGIL